MDAAEYSAVFHFYYLATMHEAWRQCTNLIHDATDRMTMHQPNPRYTRQNDNASTLIHDAPDRMTMHQPNTRCTRQKDNAPTQSTMRRTKRQCTNSI